jgi:hypothetical protein
MAREKKIRRRRLKRVKRARRRPRLGAQRGSLRGAVAGLNAYRQRLAGDRAALEGKISAIDNALSAMGGVAVSGPAGRGRRGVGRVRAGSLKEYVGRVLTGRGVMAVKDITTGVLKAGYKTKNKTLSKSVGIALTQMPGVSKVGRGRFKLK